MLSLHVWISLVLFDVFMFFLVDSCGCACVKKFQFQTNYYIVRREKRSNAITHATLFISFHSFFTHTHTHTHLARVELNRRTPRARLRSERSLVSEREREIFLLEFFQCQTTTISLLLQSFSLR